MEAVVCGCKGGRGGGGEGENEKEVGAEKETDFKVCRVGQQASEPGELKVQFESKGNLEAESILPLDNLLLLRPSIDWMRLTHITKGNLLHSESKLVFDQTFGHHSLAN